jgi:peptidoglycan-associated lipoprotein
VTASESAASADSADLSGRWTGVWVGTGLFSSGRTDRAMLELTHAGRVGRGRLVLDGAIAAESVPWEVRRAGATGTSLAVSVRGSRMTARHELNGRLFTVDFELRGDRLIGRVRDSHPPVWLSLHRQGTGPATAAVRKPEPEPVPVAVVPLEPVTTSPVTTEEPAQVVEPPTRDDTTVAEVTPTDAPPAMPDPRPRREEFAAAAELKTVHFDFDRAVLRSEAVDTLHVGADWLRRNPELLVMIEGHCDERGTNEYNLALGEQRARSAMDFLVAQGVGADRITVLSHGREQPLCREQNETCWRQNRRAEFKVRER